MKKNKAENSKLKTSVMLFGDDDITGNIISQDKPKIVKNKQTDGEKHRASVKPGNKDKQINKSKSFKDSKSKQTKTSDKHNQTPDDSINDNNKRSSSSIRNSTDKTMAKSRSRASGKIRTSKKPTDNVVQKPKRSGAVIRKDIPIPETVKGIKHTARKPIKNSGSNSKNTSPVKSRNTANAARTDGKRKTKDSTGFAGSRTCETETSGKAVPRLKRKYVRVNHIPSPCTITGNPIPIKDDPFLVRITVNGEPRDVSPWSIRNKTYYPGLDSEFLVNCLSYIDPKRKRFKD